MDEKKPARRFMSMDLGSGTAKMMAVLIATDPLASTTVMHIIETHEIRTIAEPLPLPEPPKLEMVEYETPKKKSWRQERRELPKFLR